jgi:EAL domain-containing protein (putative c-di-GMP-specific phosphodiesterase class I)
LIDPRRLELALDQLRSQADARLAVELSSAPTADQDWLTAFAMALHRHGVAQRLIVEIAEPAVVADIGATSRLVRILKDYGIKLAIGGFGAGHIPVRALRQLDVDMVRIDGAFIQAMPHSADNRFFVRTLIDLAHHLGLQTMAEWVQDEATAAQLATWGCHFLQGALPGRAELHEPRQADADGLSLPDRLVSRS